jgi:tRNA pseudouridine38-40 synthase
MRYFFRTEYNGTAYGGWQRQDNAVTVQQKLEEALGIVLRAPCRVVGAGRTDAGVHARRQGVHFDFQGEIDARSFEKSVNAVLPCDIAIFGLQTAPADFSARYSATNRRYKYYMSTSKSPLSYKQVWTVYYRDLDWDRVRQNLPALMGPHDFEAFCASGSGADSTVCAVKTVDLQHENDRWDLHDRSRPVRIQDGPVYCGNPGCAGARRHSGNHGVDH